ncbi:MAG: hypothetical protein ACRC4L_02890, partial [Mycoplasma sp.]
IGQFLDSTIFSFTFGYAKYIVYSYLILILTLKLFNLNKKILYQKRTIIFILILTSIVSIIFGTIELSYGTEMTLSHYINNIWYDTYFDFSKYFVFGVEKYLDGGILGAAANSNAWATIIVFVSLLFFVALFILLPNVIYPIKSFIISPFKKKDAINSILVKRNIFDGLKMKQNYTNQDDGKIFKIDDVIVENIIDINKEIDLIVKYLKSNNFIFSKITLEDKIENYNIKIICDEENLTKLLYWKETFNLIGLDSSYRFISTDEFAIFQYPKNKQLINQMLLNLLLSESPKNSYVACYDEAQKPIYFDLQKHYLVGVFDNGTNNVYNFYNNLITSISSRFRTDSMLLSIVSPIRSNDIAIKSPICLKNDVHSIETLVLFIDKLHEQVEWTVAKLKETKTNDIYDLKLKKKMVIKNHIVVIEDIQFIRESNNILYQKIINISKYASMCGINLIFIDKSPDAITYDEIEYSAIISFKSSPQLSKKLFDTKICSTIQSKNLAVLKLQINNEIKKVNFVNFSNSEIEYLNFKFNDIKIR